MQKEIITLTTMGAAEEQKEDAVEVADFDQNQKGVEEQNEDAVVALSGSKVGIMEGEKQIIGPFEERLAYSRGQYNCLENSTPLLVGPYHFQNEEGELGQQSIGPINSGTKVYVRRKEFKDSKTVAQSALHPKLLLAATTILYHPSPEL